MVVRLDRLARSVSHLLEVMEGQHRQRSSFLLAAGSDRHDAAAGHASLQVLRRRRAARVRADLGMHQGRHPGNSGIRARRPEASARMTAPYGARPGAGQSVTTYGAPHAAGLSWGDIARVLKQRGLDPTAQRLCGAARWRLLAACRPVCHRIPTGDGDSDSVRRRLAGSGSCRQRPHAHLDAGRFR